MQNICRNENMIKKDNNKMNLISVIVPVYKVEKYLDRCIESIVNQTHSNLEIILVDDGSPDNCPVICDKWATLDRRIKVIHKENGGLSDARNSGMAAASGEFVGFVDSDDWIAFEMYEKLLGAIKQDGSDIAACAVKMVWEDGTPCTHLIKQANCVLDNFNAQKELLLERKLKQPVWYKLYRRSTIQNILFEKGKYHEDVYWSYQIIGNAKKVSIIDFVGYYYWQRKESIMGEKYSMKRLDSIEAYCRRLEYIRQEYPLLEKRALCALWESCIYSGQMALRFLNLRERKQAYVYLLKVLKRYPISFSDYCNMSISHRVWLSISRISLRSVCRIKNILRVGF